MNRLQTLNGFQFYDDFLLDKKIGPEPFIEGNPLKTDRNGKLALDSQAHIGQLLRQYNFIDTFQQPRTKFPMDQKCRIHDSVSYSIFIHQVKPFVASSRRRVKILSVSSAFGRAKHIRTTQSPFLRPFY